MGISRNRAASSSSSASPCAQLRSAYHDCFNRWYSEKFSKGRCEEDECVAEWDKYKACLVQHLEDKHLRQILLESEASLYSVKADAGSSGDANVTSH
ncbi:uncharacterized protein At4g33100 [Ananas comosus]|uniref:Uncharacterized protein At4g33100 n=1 Tax=Ananas comosus TaxID=4615 RepID=A0A6P5FLX8_ANACO|nr:uncharacterized protein At4g33100 [Ananas comosus]XP_020097316.1 uncharacterized protein At4g33100 [Ananas comosus]XP_020097323.1 uncharacterized protein At4g33100 [Ananas comosus]XP_020097330.1 uncharacterized protein At4g33100 [Ananas comosus]XP_020097337.1 uncharacterized protein At4g33100 [Ananas comosus]